MNSYILILWPGSMRPLVINLQTSPETLTALEIILQNAGGKYDLHEVDCEN